jgi:hypothetical protein
MPGHPARPWLDMDTEIEIMPAQVARSGDEYARRRDTTITFVHNESTDDI